MLKIISFYLKKEVDPNSLVEDRLASRDGRVGIWLDEGVVDLTSRLSRLGFEGIDSLKKFLIEVEKITPKESIAVGVHQMLQPLLPFKVDHTSDEIEFRPLVPDAEKYICVGMNYKKIGEKKPAKPSLFMRARESFVGHGQNLFIPFESPQLDYEGEIVMVIGKEGRRIPQGQAHHYVAGLSLMNDGSVRDWLRHGKFNVTQGKNFTASGSLGPWLVIEEKGFNFDDLKIATYINRSLRQEGHTKDLIFSFNELISYLSIFYTLKPGDVIATGTPAGAGVTHCPPLFLQEEDRVEIKWSGVGSLINQVKKEPVKNKQS